MKRNIEQEKAIHHISGPAILVSCPGSGKTTTLIRRIQHLIENGVEPEKVLMITFTKAAAREMAEKYKKWYGNPNGVMFSTIHSLCLKILFTYGGYSVQNILNESDKRFFLIGAARDLRLEDVQKTVRAFETCYSAEVNNRKKIGTSPLSEISKRDYLYLAHRYEEMKEERGLIDYDDMLTKTLELLENDMEVRKIVQERWEYVQVDEYQDINEIQKDLIYILVENHKNLCAAGDDDQSIYRFRGARPEIMLRFKEDFPDAEMYNISTNYRSLPGIIQIADNLIRNNRSRYSKDFLSSREGEASISIHKAETRNQEIRFMADDIKKCGIPFSSTAVLYRNNFQAEFIAKVFQENYIPFYSMEKIPDSYDSWIWGDISAFYRLSHEEKTLADLLRIADKPCRYLRNIIREADSVDRIEIRKRIRFIPEDWKRQKAYLNVDTLFYNLDLLAKKNKPLDFLDSLLNRTGYGRYLREYAKETNQEQFFLEGSLEIFLEDAGKFQTMKQWMDNVRISRYTEKDKTTSQKGVCLSTMHRAKGLEWKNVYLIDINENIVPSSKACSRPEIEEERRLFYVAVTRAKDRLTVLYTKDKNKTGSRFIYELAVNSPKKKEVKSSVNTYDLVSHKDYGLCTVGDVKGNKIQLISLKDSSSHVVDISSL